MPTDTHSNTHLHPIHIKFLHANLDEIDVGTILKPRPDYVEHWSQTDFYQALEKYRPAHMLAHKEAVFMCQAADDLDNCMGGSFIFEVTPEERIERHDMHWSSKASGLIGDNAPEEQIREAALNYWNGIPSYDPLWEYMTPSATIQKVFDPFAPANPVLQGGV